MKIFLIGMPGSGKSTVGKSLAASLNMPFFDLDEVIEQEEGTTIREIFNTKGEAYFRGQEKYFLQHLTQHEPSFVLATGGGVPCFFDNMEFMKQRGKVVFLDISIASLAGRLQKEGLAVRPLLKDFSTPQLLEGHLKDIFDKRKAFYEQANIHINANKSMDRIVQNIREVIETAAF